MSEEPRQPVDRKAVMLENVRKNACEQATPECVENYLKSCEAHGGDLAEVVKKYREETTVFNLPRVDYGNKA